jgi:hypothetical protein
VYAFCSLPLPVPNWIVKAGALPLESRPMKEKRLLKLATVWSNGWMPVQVSL